VFFFVLYGFVPSVRSKSVKSHNPEEKFFRKSPKIQIKRGGISGEVGTFDRQL
jgi:hypothetical protein